MVVNGGAFAAYTSALTFTEGSHAVNFRAIDKVGNVETAQTLSLRSDATAPVTTANIGTPLFIAADGTQFISPATPVTFTSTDTTSGVQRIEVAIDGRAFAAYASALTFAEGSHTVSFRAIDNVGNVEAAQMLSLRSDATAPVTTQPSAHRYSWGKRVRGSSRPRRRSRSRPPIRPRASSVLR